MIDFDEMDDFFKRIERMIEDGPSYMRRSTQPKPVETNKSEMLLWDGELTITMDLTKYNLPELEITATHNKLFITSNDVGISYSKQILLPYVIIPKTLEWTFKGGILDISVKIDEEEDDNNGGSDKSDKRSRIQAREPREPTRSDVHK